MIDESHGVASRRELRQDERLPINTSRRGREEEVMMVWKQHGRRLRFQGARSKAVEVPDERSPRKLEVQPPTPSR